MAATQIPDRLRRFEIPGRLTLQEGNGELTKLDICTAWSRAEIYLHGAQVTAFQKKDEPPLLFLSRCSRFERGHSIRGGIQVLFPWFGAREGEPSHGFARITEWELHETVALPEGAVTARFSLPETAEQAVWPSFTAYYVVTVAAELTLELIVTNTEPDQPFTFENCLMAYLAVGDIAAVSVCGLKGLTYLDQIENLVPKTDSADAVRFEAELDRIYLDHTGPVEVLDTRWKRRIRIDKAGSASTVVWNPGLTKAQRIPDFGNEEYRQMVCVEPGNVARNSVTLQPGHTSLLRVCISTSPLE